MLSPRFSAILAAATAALIVGAGVSYLAMARTTRPISFETIPYGPDSNDDFLNPERGFYRATETRASAYAPLTVAQLEGYRLDHTPPAGDEDAQYQVQSSLVYREFVLDDFVNSPAVDDPSVPGDPGEVFLASVRADFDALQQAGMKAIVRFSYTTDQDTSCNRPTGEACPPYGDATKAVILAQIEELAPILTEYAHVIATVQLGFIGIWGETYYSDHFGDPSQSASNYNLSDTNWDDRNEVIDALQNAVPPDRMVQLRYVHFKQKYLEETSTSPSAALPLAEHEAYSGQPRARIGFYADCFLSPDNGYGTYRDFGDNGYTEAGEGFVPDLKDYKRNDSRYVVVGGETCQTNEPIHRCTNDSSPGTADQELAQLHFSFLNSEYQSEVLNDWVGNCMDDVRLRLGYRFVLQEGVFPEESGPGRRLPVQIRIENVGYAAPYNPRDVELVLRSVDNASIEHKMRLDEDPRRWFPGEVNVNHTACVPRDVAPGRYEMLFSLPAPEPEIATDWRYAIRFANEDVWDISDGEPTGYNDLSYEIEIEENSRAEACQYQIGDRAQGGIVFWVDETGEHGLVAAPEDQSEAIRWDHGVGRHTIPNPPREVNDLITMARGNGIGAGQMNTSVIVSRYGYGDGESYAARLCAELELSGYGDWYLPSPAELFLMDENLFQNGLGNIAPSTNYWTSQESIKPTGPGAPHSRRAYTAWFRSPGTQAWRLGPYKTADSYIGGGIRVRAVRAF